jgi:xenotropic and polytropic retrovirus receptor 1
LRESPTGLEADFRPESEDSGDQEVTTPMLVPGRHKGKKDSDDQLQYGSFIPTPPSSKQAQPLELPGPALSSDSDVHISPSTITPSTRFSKGTRPPPRINRLRPTQRSYSVATSGSAYEVGLRSAPSYRSQTFSPAKTRSSPQALRLMSMPGGSVGDSPRGFLHRMMSVSYSPLARTNSPKVDVSLSALDQVRSRQQEFFQWMDNELDKIETFYKSKEDEAGDRLNILREQLHVMRNRRIDEIAEAKKAKEIRKDDEHALDHPFSRHHYLPEFNGGPRPGPRDQIHAWMYPIEKAIQNAKARTRRPKPGPNSRSLEHMERTPELLSRDRQNHTRVENGRDYVRRPHYDHDVPYRSAKRKLKLALKEYYRSLELLKSYALLNRTAFRKINKKYDKAVSARPPLRYMSEKVNNAWFVQSDVLESYIVAVEDLYSRYFERGHHKVAVGKLRSSVGRHGEHTGSAFRSGLYGGTGAVFAIQGLIYAYDLLFYNTDPIIQLRTSYLLQIYGGYFLALYLFFWFCLDCCIWTRNKINYIFIFEFDPRNHLDWRELVEFPAFLFMVLGLFLWLNFSRYGAPDMFLYYPVILIFATIVTIFMPAPIIFHRSRRWFVYAHVRTPDLSLDYSNIL